MTVIGMRCHVFTALPFLPERRLAKIAFGSRTLLPPPPLFRLLWQVLEGIKHLFQPVLTLIEVSEHFERGVSVVIRFTGNEDTIENYPAVVVHNQYVYTDGFVMLCNQK